MHLCAIYRYKVVLLFIHHVANIGMLRDVDCRWITQFSALFCVLNGNGQVVTWNLTKNMTFNNVEDQFMSLCT